MVREVLGLYLWRYWLTPSDDPDFEAKVQDSCTLYRAAPQMAEEHKRVVSTDELTGAQALERLHPGLLWVGI